MDINWFESILYGIVSGLTEFLPVSSQAHQLILLHLFGESRAHPVLDLLVHIGMIAAILLSSGPMLRKTYREYRYSRMPRRRKKRAMNMQYVLDIRLIRIACVPMLLGFVLYAKTRDWSASLPFTALGLLLNGILLYFPMYLSQGNKDSRSMSILDGVLLGFGSALSILPGVSRIGAGTSAASLRGAAAQQVWKWTLLLSIPALVCFIGYDIFALFGGQAESVVFVDILKCLISGGCAYFAARVAIATLTQIVMRSNLYGFSYYSWGVALFAFILYLF